jgi:protein subunit release factor A
MTNNNLNESGLLTELFLAREPETIADHVAMLTDAPVRVTHLLTGISAIGEGQGDQVKNKERAVELLKEQLAREGHSQK